MKVIAAWKQASSDLQISIEAPFILHTDTGVFEFPILVHDFGREKGTIILEVQDFDSLSDIPEQYGYYCSALNPAVYGKYDREAFIDTLEDWGYFGEIERKPSWYQGKYYSE